MHDIINFIFFFCICFRLHFEYNFESMNIHQLLFDMIFSCLTLWPHQITFRRKSCVVILFGWHSYDYFCYFTYRQTSFLFVNSPHFQWYSSEIDPRSIEIFALFIWSKMPKICSIDKYIQIVYECKYVYKATKFSIKIIDASCEWFHLILFQSKAINSINWPFLFANIIHLWSENTTK